MSTEPPRWGSGETVLLVSADDAHAESFTREVNARSGFSVRTVGAAGEGLALLRSDTDIACIVSDHDLPDVDGIAFLEAVRAQDPEFPFILFTSEGGEEFASRAIHARVTDYLIKERSMNQWDRLLSLVEQAIVFHERTREVGDLATRARVVLEAFPDAVVILQEEAAVYATRKALALFGARSQEELRGTAAAALIDSGPGGYTTEIFRQIQTGTVHVERATVDAVRLDGRQVPIELTAAAIEWEDTPASILLCREITSRVEREARAWLADRVRPAVDAAVVAVPQSTATTVEGADPVTVRLAAARVVDVRAPVVLGCRRFPSAGAAARWLGAPVLRVRPTAPPCPGARGTSSGA